MNQTSPAIGDNFDRLLTEMPRIAQAVNEFKSEKNQRFALGTLVHAFGISAPTAKVPVPVQALSLVAPVIEEVEDDALEEIGSPSPKTRVRQGASKRAPSKKTFARAKDIDFHPEEKVSLRDFAAGKLPKSQPEKNLVIVYYLEHFLEISGIDVSHVLAAYHELGWKAPAIPDNSLMATASRHSWLDTSNMKSIRTTHIGRNATEYDLPRQKRDKRSA